MEREPLNGIAAADAHLGRAVPLPAAPVGLVRWTEVIALAADAVQVEWNLDPTRPESPGRLTLYAGIEAPPDRGLPDARPEGRYAYRSAPLPDAQPELRPVQELAWEQDGLHLRLTAQGPWVLTELLALAESVSCG